MRRSRNNPSSSTYFDLVRSFPLRRIKSRSDHAAALSHLTNVSLRFQGTNNPDILDYLGVLAGLIDDYEFTQGMKVDTSEVKPTDIIRHLMHANGLTTSALARQIRLSQSNLSEMLSGRRDFSKTAITALCKRFGLSPAIFFPEVQRRSRRRFKGAA